MDIDLHPTLSGFPIAILLLIILAECLALKVKEQECRFLSFFLLNVYPGAGINCTSSPYW